MAGRKMPSASAPFASRPRKGPNSRAVRRPKSIALGIRALPRRRSRLPFSQTCGRRPRCRSAMSARLVASAQQTSQRQIAALDELTDILELGRAQRRAATQRVLLRRTQRGAITLVMHQPSGLEASGVIDSGDERLEERLSAPAGQCDAGAARGLRSSPRYAGVDTRLDVCIGLEYVQRRRARVAEHGLRGRIGSKGAGPLELMNVRPERCTTIIHASVASTRRSSASTRPVVPRSSSPNRQIVCTARSRAERMLSASSSISRSALDGPL